MSAFRSVLFRLAWFAIATPVHGQWSTDSSSRLTIEINLPAFRLDARLDTVTVATFSVAVGMRQYQTPTGDFTITEVQWNPWWNPPDSWWARNDSVTPPGPRNPMGKVKMPLGSTKLYLHGTPLPQSIGRAASHACLRMRNDDAVALARLVQSHGGAALSDVAMDAILQQWKTTVRVSLPAPVNVRIIYRLVELRGDELLFHPDLYRRGREGIEGEALEILASTGLDTTAVDRDLLHRVAREAGRSPSSVKLSRLIMPRGEESPDESSGSSRQPRRSGPRIVEGADLREGTMKARDIMHWNPTVVTPDEAVSHAAEHMRYEQDACVPVVEDVTSRILVGVITARDLVTRCMSRKHVGECTVGDHMTPLPLHTVRLDDDIETMLNVMHAAGVRRLPVVSSGGVLLGVVTEGAVGEALATAEWAKHPFAHLGNGLIRSGVRPS